MVLSFGFRPNNPIKSNLKDRHLTPTMKISNIYKITQRLGIIKIQPSGITSSMKLSPDITIGPSTLRVKDMQKQMTFYKNILNLQENRRYSEDGFDIIELGFKEKFKQYKDPLLILKHDPDAKETSHNFAGLYHFAILVPDRKSLASAYISLARTGVPFDGFADHLVSESLYLHDPERNGIEIYRDKPKNTWQYDRNGHVVMDTLPLHLESVVSELESDDIDTTFPNGAKIGHMHLRVTNLQNSSKFYQRLGFGLTSDWSRMGANFLAAGGYHHHIGMNIWHSLNGKTHTKDEAGLDVFMIQVQENSIIETLAQELREHVKKRNKSELLLSDPDRIRVLIKSD
jgi:catechol 2,3-dioxygenase